jgi:hypothetical protein
MRQSTSAINSDKAQDLSNPRDSRQILICLVQETDEPSMALAGRGLGISWLGAAVLALGGVIFFAPAKSDNNLRLLNPEAVFHRCYSHLTGLVAGPDHASLDRVRQGQDPVEECLGLFRSTRLADSGLLTRDTRETRAILNHFQNLHTSWFRKRWMMDGDILAEHASVIDVHDGTEPAAYFTFGLFGPTPNFRVALTASRGLTAIRDGSVRSPELAGTYPRPSMAYWGPDPSSYRHRLDAAQIHFINRTPDPNVANDALYGVPVATEIITSGQLIGIRPSQRQLLANHLVINPISPAADVRDAANSQGFRFPADLFAHFGGGVIGSQPYLLMNFGHPYTTDMNGTNKLPRRWMEAIFSDLLCRKLPVARAGDVARWVDGQASEAFRQNATCVQCHASLDQTALVASHLRAFATMNGYVEAPRVGVSMVPGTRNQSPPAFSGGWPTQPVANIHQMNVPGALLFRGYDGSLHQAKVTQIASVGEYLAQTDDFHVCAASRYFQHFTGFKVDLYDPGDPQYAQQFSQMTRDARLRRQFVIDLGLELKATNSAASVITRILQSDFYRYSDLVGGDN